MNIIIWQTLPNISSSNCPITVGGSFLHDVLVLVHYCLCWLGLRALPECWRLIVYTWDAYTHDQHGQWLQWVFDKSSMKTDLVVPSLPLAHLFPACPAFAVPPLALQKWTGTVILIKITQRCSCTPLRQTSRHGPSPVHCTKWTNMLWMLLSHYQIFSNGELQ